MTAQIQVRRDIASNWTSANPILRSGEIGYETDTGNVKIGNGTLAWASLPYAAEQHTYTAYTPTLAQGASSNIAKTVNYAKYTKVGKIVQGNVKVTSTSTGSASAAITLSLPVTAATSGLIIGSATYFDSVAATTEWRGFLYSASTTTGVLLAADTALSALSVATALGVNPAHTVASGDIFNISFQYEAA